MSRAAHPTPLTSRHPCLGAVLRPPAPRQRVPSFRARPRTDAELRAGHRRTTPADRLHLGRLIDSRRGRGQEVRCLAAGDLRLHPPLSPSRGSTKAEAEQPRKVGSGLLGSGEFSPLLRAVIALLPRPRVLRVDGGWGPRKSRGHLGLRILESYSRRKEPSGPKRARPLPRGVYASAVSLKPLGSRTKIRLSLGKVQPLSACVARASVTPQYVRATSHLRGKRLSWANTMLCVSRGPAFGPCGWPNASGGERMAAAPALEHFCNCAETRSSGPSRTCLRRSSIDARIST